MRKATSFLILVGSLFGLLPTFNPVFGQDDSDPNCQPSVIADEFSTKLATADSLQAIQFITNELTLAIASCNAAGEDVGKSRSNPVPVRQRREFSDDGYALTMFGFRDVTDILAEADYQAPEGMRYIAVYFQYDCTLSIDEMCSGGLSILDAVGTSGTVYEYEMLFISDMDFSWEVFGGGTKDDLITVFLVKSADVGTLLTFAGSEYDDTRAFFALEELPER